MCTYIFAYSLKSCDFNRLGFLPLFLFTSSSMGSLNCYVCVYQEASLKQRASSLCMLGWQSQRTNLCHAHESSKERDLLLAKENLSPAAKSRRLSQLLGLKHVLRVGQIFHLVSWNTCLGIMNEAFSSGAVSRWAFWAAKDSTEELLHITFLSMMHRWLNLKLISCHMVGFLLFRRWIKFPSFLEAWCHFLSRLHWKYFNPLHSVKRK